MEKRRLHRIKFGYYLSFLKCHPYCNVKPNPRNNSKNQDREPYQSGTHIFDEKLYKKRTVIEHFNA